ncbi:DUF4430 domain-containing protein [Marinicrinis sediminis]|uniref:DUF4430 domain-containing protein n=1 Tax=Marinicrinis sediminis TaxID=1652465 RepID=A0ABW5R7U9_9BACL
MNERRINEKSVKTSLTNRMGWLTGVLLLVLLLSACGVKDQTTIPANVESTPPNAQTQAAESPSDPASESPVETQSESSTTDTEPVQSADEWTNDSDHKDVGKQADAERSDTRSEEKDQSPSDQQRFAGSASSAGSTASSGSKGSSGSSGSSESLGSSGSSGSSETSKSNSDQNTPESNRYSSTPVTSDKPAASTAAPQKPAGESSKQAQTEPQVALMIQGLDGEEILNVQVEIEDGDSVLDVLKRETKARRIQMEYRGRGALAYVEGIDNLYEFDHGPTSGWTYTVNGDDIDKSAGTMELSPGDTIEWRYTKEAKAS